MWPINYILFNFTFPDRVTNHSVDSNFVDLPGKGYLYISRMLPLRFSFHFHFAISKMWLTPGQWRNMSPGTFLVSVIETHTGCLAWNFEPHLSPNVQTKSSFYSGKFSGNMHLLWQHCQHPVFITFFKDCLYVTDLLLGKTLNNFQTVLLFIISLLKQEF